MPAPGQTWPLDFKVVTCVIHSLAIASGIFRLTYRSYLSRFGWEDMWALLALVTDIGCVICLWLQRSAPLHLSRKDIILNYVATTTLTGVPWEARLSMITTLIRITNPCARIRRASYAIALSFVVMWFAIFAAKLYVCSTNFCYMTHDVTLAQLTTDAISDVALMVMPVFILKGMKISRGQRLMLVASFASSIGITIISTAHAVTFFLPRSSITILMVNIKAAIALLVCNLLVIVMFVHRFFNKTEMDSETEPIQFTTLVPGQVTLESTALTASLQMSSVYHARSTFS